jgi:MFS family permease
MFSNTPPVQLPLVGTIRGWQLTFFVVGIPGLVVAALMRTVREPRRRGLLAASGGHTVNSPKPVPIRDVLAFMGDNARTYLPLYVGMGVNTVMLFGTAAWGPAFYRRAYGWTPARFGLVQGLLLVTLLPLGAFVGSLLAERYARKGYDDANMRVVLLASVIALPGSILFPLMPNATLAVVISAYSMFTHAWVAGPINAALQVITPNQMRGQITALFLFVFNVIGFGVGPSAVAFFTDYIFRNESMIGYSLCATAAILGPLGALIYWLTLKPYGRSVLRAKAWG